MAACWGMAAPRLVFSYKVDRVQRAAARYCLNDYNYTSSVTEMLKILNWQTLENRRIQNSLILLYEGLDGGSWYSLITKNLAIYSLSLKFWLIH